MKSIEIKVNNMKCMGCASTVQTNLSRIQGVDSVEAFLDTKSVSIAYNGSSDVLDDIYRTLETIGFPAEKR